MKVSSSSGVFSTSITIEVIYCYLEKKKLKSFEIPYEYCLLL